MSLSWIQFAKQSNIEDIRVYDLRSYGQAMRRRKGGFLIFQLQPSPIIESVIVLLAAGLIFLLAAVLIFERKEYILSDNA